MTGKPDKERMGQDMKYVIDSKVYENHINDEVHLYGLLHQLAFLAGKTKDEEDLDNLAETAKRYGEIAEEKFAAWRIPGRYSCISEDGKKLFAPEKESIGACPRCGQPVYEGKKNFACSDRSCGFVLWKNDRFWTSRKKELTKKMAADLLKKGRTNVKGMWSEKKQTAYDAAVILCDTGGRYIDFKLEFPKNKRS